MCEGKVECLLEEGKGCEGNGGVGLEKGEGVGLEGAESEEGRGCTTKIELKIWDQ